MLPILNQPVVDHAVADCVAVGAHEIAIRCGFLTFGQRSDTHSCQGLFTSDDAELRLQPVTFDHAGGLDPGTRLTASVSGPDDGTATVGGTRSVGMRVVLAVVSVAGLVAVLLRFRRLLLVGRSSRVGATRPDGDTPAVATGVARPADTRPGTSSLGSTRIVWTHTGNGESPYRAVAGGHELTVRVNDFPAKMLYTVIVDGVETEDLEDWPPEWIRPRVPRATARLAAQRHRMPAERYRMRRQPSPWIVPARRWSWLVAVTKRGGASSNACGETKVESQEPGIGRNNGRRPIRTTACAATCCATLGPLATNRIDRKRGS
ncbi:hypothetical protein OG792_20995 [Micromonospora sp. NBC_01699]|uniref:hypothetical protein n=1 Tax=Micromonospora sp. NBC_01699 TaxID=2975984 RepID=UPI002E2AB1EF|nr:hypothetical protein [Micromonospora sp. NBC_01699]